MIADEQRLKYPYTTREEIHDYEIERNTFLRVQSKLSNLEADMYKQLKKEFDEEQKKYTTW